MDLFPPMKILIHKNIYIYVIDNANCGIRENKIVKTELRELLPHGAF